MVLYRTSEVPDNIVSVLPVNTVIDGRQYSQLVETISPDVDDHNYVIDTFLQVRNFVNALLSNH